MLAAKIFLIVFFAFMIYTIIREYIAYGRDEADRYIATFGVGICFAAGLIIALSI